MARAIPSREEFADSTTWGGLAERVRWCFLKPYYLDIACFGRTNLNEADAKWLDIVTVNDYDCTYEDLLQIIEIHKRVLPQCWREGVMVGGL